MNIIDIAKEAGVEYEKSDLGNLCLTKYGEEIVAIVKENPGSIKKIEGEFIDMWNNPREIPYELISLCMYHLKLPGVRSYIEEYRNRELEKNNWRAESPTRDILAAYKEPWEDYDLFYE